MIITSDRRIIAQPSPLVTSRPSRREGEKVLQSVAFQGSASFLPRDPGRRFALPRAGMFRPFGAQSILYSVFPRPRTITNSYRMNLTRLRRDLKP